MPFRPDAAAPPPRRLSSLSISQTRGSSDPCFSSLRIFHPCTRSGSFSRKPTHLPSGNPGSSQSYSRNLFGIRCSKMWLLMQIPSISSSIHQLMVELSTLLDIFPAKQLYLNEDVEELLNLIKKQCSQNARVDSSSSSRDDTDGENLRAQVLTMLEGIKKEIVPDPSSLSEIFERLDLSDSASCSREIENLEDEVQNQRGDDKSKADAVALIGLVRYAKCVLYGASTPRTGGGGIRRQKSAGEVSFPSDFRCPISLDLMRDPVVVSTGQTYDRSSINLWIESGHATCPKTGQTLAHTQLIPNLALKNLIGMWCRDQRIRLEEQGQEESSTGASGRTRRRNKTALGATKMTISFLVSKLRAFGAPSEAAADADRVVHELRVLAKTDSDSRACIAEAGALPLLAKFLGCAGHPSLQINAVTAILNLSILEANKARIMEADGVVNGVIEVLRSGATWEAKGNAAATIFSLTGSGDHSSSSSSSTSSYRKRLGKKGRVVKGLLDLARQGPGNAKRDAMMAILNLAGDREAAGRLLEGGVVDVIGEAMDDGEEEEEEVEAVAVAVLEMVVKKGGLVAISAAYHGNMVRKLGKVMRDGSDRGRESAAATLVNMCRKGGAEMVGELAAIAGIERVIWEMMGGMGTERARRKAATLLRVLRRWAAAGLVNEGHQHQLQQHHSVVVSPASASTRIVLPAA
ncbi:U-box domain-containing protein 16 isoform X2 [Andrographis paniculata]|uniref:U-box domain-containing protein 16 isoform X2 n=1 Tax=Andrographis paniculata TaxID=175694 RepID=UPI0021E7ED5E|nr:U-box domain-containing protein 16 isoform X2 [Andrographis paniculata]